MSPLLVDNKIGQILRASQFREINAHSQLLNHCLKVATRNSVAPYLNR